MCFNARSFYLVWGNQVILRLKRCAPGNFFSGFRLFSVKIFKANYTNMKSYTDLKMFFSLSYPNYNEDTFIKYSQTQNNSIPIYFRQKASTLYSVNLF